MEILNKLIKIQGVKQKAYMEKDASRAYRAQITGREVITGITYSIVHLLWISLTEKNVLHFFHKNAPS